jgi:asparagine synthase (glutamine-hydrolysing)
MCGVLAYAGKKNSALDACLAQLHHRGPDHTGKLQEGEVTLGHCRLSIIDVDARSQQPMVSASGHNTIVFNGEIYNFRELREELVREGVQFRTEGDTEVILEGYELQGVSFFDRLRGMWALVIHDHRRNQLIAARDPFGIKPLVYAVQDDAIYFASEIKCLKKALTLEPDPVGYSVFYNLGYFIAPATPYKNVWKLCPGEVLSWDLQENAISHVSRISRYAGNATDANRTPSEGINFLDQALTDSVKAHYVADVPVAILLSGGNDSSLIAALSNKLGKKPTAYHVAIAGSTDTAYAEAVAKHLGTTLVIEGLTEGALHEQYEKIWNILDEPTGDISIIPTSLVFERIKGHEKVVLSGEGGDELFGGYMRHQLLSRHDRVSKKDSLNSFLNTILSSSPSALTSWNPLVQRVRSSLLWSSGTNDLIGAYLKSTRLMDYPLSDAVVRSQLYELYQAHADENGAPPLAFDTIAYLPNDLLVKSDTASMAYSIEARVPFLDRFLARDVASVMKYGGKKLGDKHLLKEVLLRYLPENLVYRDKSGFGVPMHAYDSKAFISDFHTACAFHLKNRDAFGVNDTMAKFISEVSAREIIVRKYPRFAFALVSNWKYFTI